MSTIHIRGNLHLWTGKLFSNDLQLERIQVLIERTIIKFETVKDDKSEQKILRDNPKVHLKILPAIKYIYD